MNNTIQKNREQSEKDISTSDGLTSEELNDIIDEMEQEQTESVIIVGDKPTAAVEEKIKKPSFIQNLVVSLKRKNINSKNQMKYRFQKLANIKPSATGVAVLKFKNGATVDFSEIPSWVDIVRFKICGFDFEIFSETKLNE